MPAGNKKDHAKMELPPQKILDIVKGEGFTVGDKIRPGSTSVICKASSTKVTVPLAVKIIDIKRLSKRYRAIYGPREITISKRVNHKNVIKTHKVLVVNRQYVFIFMDLATDGDLLDYIEKHEGALEMAEIKRLYYQICEGVAYLHRHHIAHRDLKGDNILMVAGVPKVSDFGIATLNKGRGVHNDKSVQFCGTIEYAAPEVVVANPLRPYDPYLADSWSLGVILFTITTNDMPFGYGHDLYNEAGRNRLLKDQMGEKWRKKLSPEQAADANLVSLMRALMNPMPKKRLRVHQTLTHPFFNDRDKDQKRFYLF